MVTNLLAFRKLQVKGKIRSSSVLLKLLVTLMTLPAGTRRFKETEKIK